MEPARDPFEILGIAPESSPEAIDHAYKAKARQFHPDIAGPAGADEMRAVNWARDELRSDLNGWRARAIESRGKRQVALPNTTPSDVAPQRGGASSSPPATTTHRVVDWIEVAPQVLFFKGEAGATGSFVARTHNGVAATIVARFRVEDQFRVERVGGSAAEATFRVTLTADLRKGHEARVSAVDLLANGVVSNRVFISVAPLSVTPQEPYAGPIAPARVPEVTQKLSFGKHKGRTFWQVAMEEPGYLQWMLRKGAGSVVERQCAALALRIDWSPTPFDVEWTELAAPVGNRAGGSDSEKRPGETAVTGRLPRGVREDGDVPLLPERREVERGLLSRARRRLLGGPK